MTRSAVGYAETTPNVIRIATAPVNFMAANCFLVVFRWMCVKIGDCAQVGVESVE